MDDFNLFALENKIQQMEDEIQEMRDLEMSTDAITKREEYLSGLMDAKALVTGEYSQGEESEE